MEICGPHCPGPAVLHLAALFQLSSTKDGSIATNAFFHIKVAVRAQAEEAALFFLGCASWTA